MFFKNMKKQRKIKSRKDGRKGRALTHSNIDIKRVWREIVPIVRSFPIDEVVQEESSNLWTKSSFIQNQWQEAMIKRREKLSDVKG